MERRTTTKRQPACQLARVRRASVARPRTPPHQSPTSTPRLKGAPTSRHSVIGKPTLDPLHSGLRTGSYGEQGQMWPEKHASRGALKGSAQHFLDRGRLLWLVGTEGFLPLQLMRSGPGCGRVMRPSRSRASWGSPKAACVPTWCGVVVSGPIHADGPADG